MCIFLFPVILFGLALVLKISNPLVLLYALPGEKSSARSRVRVPLMESYPIARSYPSSARTPFPHPLPFENRASPDGVHIACPSPTCGAHCAQMEDDY